MSGREPGDESLVSILIRQAGALLQGEVDLVKARIERALHRAIFAIGLAVFAAVLGMTALNFAAEVAVQKLVESGWEESSADGLVAAGAAAAALLCLLAGGLLLRGLIPNSRRERRRRDRR
ncbi:phage holin family protein [Poseidonocella sp. HB161398]|uniref:phage holin family protein n=1 Tax=Poseidonocella sp. HB161398 TaxID=2320855 RepID=UPI001109183A|nr:phage holin family protein [Poseidonocella sp. HB161398]